MLKNPHSTEINVIAEGSANFERCTALLRLALRSLMSSFRFFILDVPDLIIPILNQNYSKAYWIVHPYSFVV
jgi:hypothetical protein